MPNINEIEIIKAELQRSYNQCFNTSSRVLLVNARNYFNFIYQTPLLKTIVEDEGKNFENNIKNKVYKDYEFLAWISLRDLPGMLDRFMKEREEGRFLTKPWFQKLNERLLGSRYRNTTSNRDKTTISLLKITHDFLMRKIATQQLGNHTAPLPSEAAISLAINKDTKWENIEIMFINGSDIRIKYKGKQFKTNNEKMDFIDRRKGTEPKSSWKFLQLLSIKNGIFPLEGLNKDRLEKLKKRKQELSAQLKQYLQIDGDPFEPVNIHSRFYKLKSKIVPEAESREDWKDKDIFDE